MSNPRFSNYVSPNIVIVPTVSFCGPPSKKQKPNVESQPATQAIPVVPIKNSNQHCEAIFPIENISKNVSIQDNPWNLRSAEDTTKNDLEDSEQRVRKTLSWASNYLQSIGQSQLKDTKIATPAHQKIIPKVVESRHQNTNKNLFKLFKPTFENVSQNLCSNNNLPRGSNANGGKNGTPTQSYSTKANNNSHDAKYPIKINLLYQNRNTDPFSDKANTHNVVKENDVKTLNFGKPNIEEKTHCILSSVKNSKIFEKNDNDSEKNARDPKTQNLRKSYMDDRTDYISTPSHSKSREINTTDKEKHYKDVKSTNSKCTPKKVIPDKKYTDVSKDRNKVSRGRKLLDKTKNVDLDKSSSKSRYKTKDELEAWSTDRIKSSLKKPLRPHGKDRLEEWAFKRIKTHPEKPSHSHIRASSNASRNESKKETIKPKSKIPSLKKENDDHTKSKPSKITYDDDHKINSKQSTKSNENHIKKTREKSQSACMKSVVQIKNNFDLDIPFKTVPENGHHIEDLRTKVNTEIGQNVADLRDKLKRKYQTAYPSKRDNLIITVQNDKKDKEDINDHQLTTAEEKPKLEKKTRKYKKIKLVINIVCGKCSESSESDSDNKNNEEYPVANVDLSFLDDFNVDDIVDSLNDQENKTENNSPTKTNDKKITISEIDAKPSIKNEDKEDIKCINIPKRLHESPHFKMDVKQEVIAQDTQNANLKKEIVQNSVITGYEIQTAGTPQNNKEKNEFEGKSYPVFVTEKSNTLISSPMKPATNQNNKTIVGTTSNDENIKKVLNIQNNTRVDKLKDSNEHKPTNNNIMNINTERHIEGKEAVIIDLTRVETSITQETKKISSNKNIVNNKILKHEAGKLHKTRENPKVHGIIDLTTSTETEVEVMKNIKSSVINTPVQRLIEIKENTTNCETYKENQSKIKNVKKKDTHVPEIPLPRQDNKSKVTGINSDIIDLTVEQQHVTKEKEKINNSHVQTTGIESKMKKHIEISHPAKNIIDGYCQQQADKSSSDISAADNSIQEKATEYVQAIDVARGSRQCEINKTSQQAETATESQERNATENLRNNAKTKTNMKESTEDGINNAQTTEIVPGLQNPETNETSSIENIDDIGNAQPTKRANLHISNNTSSKDDINVPLKIKGATPQNNITKNAISSQQVCDSSKPNIQELAKAVKDDTKDVLSKTGSLDEHLTRYNSVPSNSDNIPIYTPTGSIKSPIVFDAKEEATSEPIKSKQEIKTIEKNQAGEYETDKNKEKNDSAETEESVLEKRTLSIENNDDTGNAQSTKIANLHISNNTSSKDDINVPLKIKEATQQNNITKNAISSQQVCDSSKPNVQELAKAVKDTKFNDDTEDVLSTTGSLDEHLTSYKSVATDSDKTPIYTPTGSIKSLIVFDAKDEATSGPIKSKQESKTIEKKQAGEYKTDKNKEKNDSAETEESVLEKRMMEYFRGKKYSIESLIRQGKFSKIYRCKDGNGRNYALKVLNKGTRMTGCSIENMLKELQRDIPRKNYHCVILVDGFATLHRWCFLMDFYPKNMKEVLYENGKCFHIDVVLKLARQLISAVLILRNHNIMHLDIKPSHILMNTSNDRLKLAGFDESQFLEGLSVLPNVGTVNYRPPEVILGYPYFGKIDVWSTALVIYEMCTARQLFPGHYNNDILYKQMCTLGEIPYQMVFQSVFANKHYRGAYFARRLGPAGQEYVLIGEFNKSMRLATTLFQAYQRDWENLRTRRQKADDSEKLSILRDLLEDMLMLDPNFRIPIEFVYTSSLIYETFDSCV